MLATFTPSRTKGCGANQYPEVQREICKLADHGLPGVGHRGVVGQVTGRPAHDPERNNNAKPKHETDEETTRRPDAGGIHLLQDHRRQEDQAAVVGDPRSLKGLRKGRQLTFAEVNELAAKKAPVWLEYEGRDGEREGAFWAGHREDGGWDFDDGLGLVIVEKDGSYGPLGDKGKKWNGAVQNEPVGQKYDPKAMFLSAYVYGVFEAVKR